MGCVGVGEVGLHGEIRWRIGDAVRTAGPCQTPVLDLQEPENEAATACDQGCGHGQGCAM